MLIFISLGMQYFRFNEGKVLILIKILLFMMERIVKECSSNTAFVG